MLKLFPQFEHLHAYWVNGQPTTSFILNPKNLNHFFKLVHSNSQFVDYNVTIDKIIQISPCYDINTKDGQKEKNSVRNSMGSIQTGKVSNECDIRTLFRPK